MNKNLKTILAFVAFAAIAGAVLYFSNRGNDGNEVVLEITAMLPLTGPAAAFGQDEKSGMEAALANSELVSLDCQDSQGKPDIAVSILQQSYELKGRRVFVCSTTGPSMAVLPILRDKDDESLVFVIATLSDITVDFPNAIRIYPSVDEEIRVLGDFAEESGFKSIAALCVRNQAGEDAIRTMSNRSAQFGGSVIYSDTFAANEKDFRSILQKIKSQKPDALLVTGYSFNYVDIFKQMIESDFDVPVLAGVGVPLAGLEEAFPKPFLKRVVFPATKFSYSKDDPKVKEFERLVASKGKVANYEMAFAFDTMNLILNSVEPDQSPAELLEQIMANQPFEGVNGSIKLDQNRDARLQLEPCRYGQNGIERLSIK
ncbi:MAG: ABC transporter substrate-binding protein [Planctomycetota bacterium]